MAAAKSIRPLAFLTCLVAVAGLCALLVSLSHEVLSTSSRVSEALERWESKDLPGTMAWRTRAYLARLTWLGRFRPVPPEDPLAVCGLTDKASCSNFPLTAGNTRKLLRCLDEKMREEEEHHAVFKGRLHCFLSLIFGGVILAFLVLLTCILRQGSSRQDRNTSEDRLDSITLFKAEEDKDTEDDFCDDLSSDEYEDCLEKACFYRPGSSQDCAEGIVCDITDGSNYCNNSSPEVYEDCLEYPTWSVYPEDYYKNKKKRKRRVRNKEDTCLGDQKAATDDTSVPVPVSVYPEENNKKKKEEKSPVSKNEDTCLEDQKIVTDISAPVSVYPENKKEDKRPVSNIEDTCLDEKAVTDISVPVSVYPENMKEDKRPVSNKEDTCLDQKAVTDISVPVPVSVYPKDSHKNKKKKKKRVKNKKDTCLGGQKVESKVEKCLEAETELHEVLLEVQPQQRRYIIGWRGTTIQLLGQAYPAVHVSVPPLNDLTSTHVALKGPQWQVAAAARDIMARLEAAEEE